MKFLDFFQFIKGQDLSRERKDLIFAAFQAKKRQWLFLQKMSVYTRVWALSLFIFAGLAVVYFWSIWWEEWNRELNDGFIWFNIEEGSQVAYADEIWQIITTVGDVKITNNWITKSWSWLANADKVLLLVGAELVFEMQGWVQAKIIWPAEFELEKKDDKYLINMITGEFVEIKSVIDTEEDQPLTDREFVADVPNDAPIKTTKDNINVQVIVKTPEFEVVSDTSRWDIDMTITTEEDGKQVVENVWTDVVITKIIKDETVITELKSQQKAAINWEVHIAMITPDIEINEKQAEAIVENIKNNDLTISYKIEDSSNNEVETSKQELKKEDKAKVEEPLKNQAVPKVNDNSDNKPVAKVVEQEKEGLVEDPAPVLEDLVADRKRVIDWSQLAMLQQATHGSVLMRDIRNIVASHVYWYEPGVQTSLTNLASSLHPVTQNILWWMNLTTSSISWMASSLESLISNLEAKRYVPPVYINRLKSTIAWLRLVQTVPSASVEATCDFDCIVTDVLKVQPNQRVRLMLQ